MWHGTCDTWHITCDMQHMTHDRWGRSTFSPNFSSLAPTVREWRYSEDWEEKEDLPQCFHRALWSIFAWSPCWCSTPPSSLSFAVDFLSIQEAGLASILYAPEFFSQSPLMLPGDWQCRQSSLAQPSLLRGPGLASTFTDLPALGQTWTLIPFICSNFSRSVFILSSISPGTGSRIRGAESWPGCELCQFDLMLSLANLLSLLLHSLGLSIGLSPCSSSLHSFLPLPRAAFLLIIIIDSRGKSGVCRNLVKALSVQWTSLQLNLTLRLSPLEMVFTLNLDSRKYDDNRRWYKS